VRGLVLDAWAVVAFLKGERAARAVRGLIEAGDARICSVNLGEALYAVTRSHGAETAENRVERLRSIVEVDDPDWPLVRAAARLKVRGGISFPDCFALALAERRGLPLYTGDDEIIRYGAEVDVIDLRNTA